MDRETKKKTLAKFVTLRHEVESKEDRLRQLESEAALPPMKQGDGSQHTSGDGYKNERAYIRYIEYKDRHLPLIESYRRDMQAIEKAIEALTDPLERSVLVHRYIESDTVRLQNWRDIAIEIYGDDDERDLQAVYRLHNKALDNINLEHFDEQTERKEQKT